MTARGWSQRQFVALAWASLKFTRLPRLDVATDTLATFKSTQANSSIRSAQANQAIADRQSARCVPIASEHFAKSHVTPFINREAVTSTDNLLILATRPDGESLAGVSLIAAIAVAAGHLSSSF